MNWICMFISPITFKHLFTKKKSSSTPGNSICYGNVNQKKPVILFDGICNLCNASVNFILKRDKNQLFRYVSLQSEEGEKLISHYAIPKNVDSVILIKNKEVYLESEAAVEIAAMLPRPWSWMASFSIIPRKLRDKIYRCIARNRYRWFGKRETCRVIQN
jgi:predicted DCC family thiol-disulfide oxidoreductase YuxK